MTPSDINDLLKVKGTLAKELDSIDNLITTIDCITHFSVYFDKNIPLEIKDNQSGYMDTYGNVFLGYKPAFFNLKDAYIRGLKSYRNELCMRIEQVNGVVDEVAKRICDIDMLQTEEEE